MRSVTRAGLCLAMLVPLPGCGTNIVMHTIPASETAQDCKNKADKSGSILGVCFTNLASMGQACETSVPNKVAPPGKVTDLQKASPIVGWEARWKGGTCWEYSSGASRAYVNFAIFPTLTGKADRIVSAQLKWSPSTKHTAADQTFECYSRVYEATGPWKSFATPGEWIAEWEYPEPADFVPIPSLDVSNIIRRWAKGDQQYFGFYFTSFREDLFHGIDDRCLTTLKDLRLEVTVNEIVPWPGT
jgi:hypothetical protein